MYRIAHVVVPGVPHHISQRGNRHLQTFFCDVSCANWQTIWYRQFYRSSYKGHWAHTTSAETTTKIGTATILWFWRFCVAVPTVKPLTFSRTISQAFLQNYHHHTVFPSLNTSLCFLWFVIRQYAQIFNEYLSAYSFSHWRYCLKSSSSSKTGCW